MKDHEIRRALLAFFHAIKTGDVAPLEKVISEQTCWEVPGKSAFAGKYTGPDECARMILARRERSSPPLEPFGEDVGITPYHGVLLFAVRGHRNGRTLTSHEIIVAGYGPEAIERIHHYIYRLNTFDAFWG